MTSLATLVMKRDRLNEATRLIAETSQNMKMARDQAQYDTTMAVVWAAVLLTADVLREGVSLQDKTGMAAMGFSAIDKGIAGANKLLTAFKVAPITRKQDALASLDPELRKASKMAEHVSSVGNWVKKTGTDRTVQSRGQIATTLNLLTVMTQDVLLMLQAGNDQSRLWATNSAAIARVEGQLQKIKMTLANVNRQIAEWLTEFERQERLKHIA